MKRDDYLLSNKHNLAITIINYILYRYIGKHILYYD